jgi:hypothetical protein
MKMILGWLSLAPLILQLNVSLSVMSDKFISGFFLLDAPENVEISVSFLELEEGEVMEPILCSADASPEATFVWKFNDEVVSEDSVLEFLEPIKKYDFNSLLNQKFIFYLCLGSKQATTFVTYLMSMVKKLAI